MVVRRRNPSAASTVALTFASVAAGGLLGYSLGLLLCVVGIGGGGSIGGGSYPVDVVFSGTTCSISGVPFACDEIVARLRELPRETLIVLHASMGAHSVVQGTIDALAEAGFTNVGVVVD